MSALPVGIHGGVHAGIAPAVSGQCLMLSCSGCPPRKGTQSLQGCCWALASALGVTAGAELVCVSLKTGRLDEGKWETGVSKVTMIHAV